jgi:hypothetical protein
VNNTNHQITLTEHNDARIGGRFFVAGQNDVRAIGFSRTCALRNLKRTIKLADCDRSEIAFNRYGAPVRVTVPQDQFDERRYPHFHVPRSQGRRHARA